MSPSAQQVVETLQQVPAANQELSVDDLTTSANTPGERSLIAEFKARRPVALREGVAYDLHLAAYEEFTTDGTGGNSETFSLSHSLVDSKAIADDIVVYKGNSDVTSDVTPDFANDEFDYTDSGTDNTLHVYYITDAQAKVSIEKRAPSNHYATLDERDAGLVNLRDQARDPLEFEFNDVVAGVIPTDWRIEIYVDAPYQIQWEDGTDTDATARNALVTLPIRRGDREIPGLGSVVTNRIDEV